MSSTIARELARLKKAASNLSKDLSLLEGFVQESGTAPETEEERKIILIEEMASILKISVTTTRRWIHDGRLDPYYKKGRQYYWLRADLDKILTNAGNENSKK